VLKLVPEYRSELIKIAAHALENVGRRSRLSAFWDGGALAAAMRNTRLNHSPNS